MKTTWIQSEESHPFRICQPGQGKAASELAITGRDAQTICGFGGCFNEMGWDALQSVSRAKQTEILRNLFHPKTCAFSYNRLPIGANDYALDWYSLNDTAGDYAMRRFSVARDRQRLIPYIKSALAYQPAMTLFASPWCPPAWMKTTQVYNAGSLTWTKKNLAAYALYFQKFVEAYRKEGVRIAQIHVQNEPNSNQKFPSCLWTGEQMRDFIRDHLGPRFEREKVSCEIWAGTIEKGIDHGWDYGSVGTNDYSRWAHLILSDAKARRYVSGVGYQWDGKGAIQRTHAAWPDLPFVQTENECGNGTNSWKYAHHVFGLIWHYFINGAAAYVYWNMVLPEGGVSTWGWPQNSLITITGRGAVRYNPEYYVMRHFAQYVKPGAVRLELDGMMAAFALAFRNPDKSVVAVIANPLERDEPIRLRHGQETVTVKLAPCSFSTICFRA
jgi:glucosylceramidase